MHLQDKQVAPIRRPVHRVVEPISRDYPAAFASGDVANDHVLLGRLPVVGGIGDGRAIRRPPLRSAEKMLDIRLGRNLVRLPSTSWNRENLRELVAVVIGGVQQRFTVRRPGDLAYRLLAGERHLAGIPTVARLPP